MANATTPVIQINEGNVGIGTATPSAKLDVQGTQGQLFSVTDDLSGSIFAVADISGVPIFDVNSSGTSYFDGNVGIGTTNPGAKLEVYGSSPNILINNTAETDSGIVFTDAQAGTGQRAAIKFNSSDNKLKFFVNDEVAQRMVIDTGGNVGIGTTDPGAKLTVKGTDSLNAFKITDSGDGDGFKVTSHTTQGTYVQIYNAAHTQTIMLDGRSDSTARHTYFNGGGNVGIGATNPLEKLEVEGTMYATPIAYAASQSAYALKMGAYNNTAFDQGIKIKSTSTGQSYMSFNDRSEDALVLRGAKVGIGTDNPGYRLDVSGNGRYTSTVTATNFILSSDERLKDNIKEIDTNYIDVNWKNFELKSEPGVKRAGVIAQELEEKHPEFVRTDDEGMKSVAYIDLLIAKIAELEARLEKAGI